MDLFWSAPPVTRTITAVTFLQSALILGGLLDASWSIFYLPWVFKIYPEIWRIFSAFLLTGGGLSFIFDLYFMYTYGNALETGSARFSVPGDFFTYVIFVGLVILLFAGCLMRSMVFTSALILAFVYTFAQDNRGRRATFFIVQIPVEFLPWAMLTWTFVTGGFTATMIEGSGIIAAHLYDFLTRIYPAFGGGKNYIRTPALVRRWFGSQQPRQIHRGYGVAYRAGNRDTPGSSNSSWYSSLGGSWSGRGAGRRLGGD